MCGHVGIAGKLENKDEQTMKRLLLFDYFRGPDSTGFAALRSTPKGEAHLCKIASNPLDLFDMKKFGTALNAFNSTVFLGHNRLATKGVVNNYNAHPYLFEKEGGVIVGAHNGTLDKSSWDAIEDKLGEKFPVDSMAVVAAIAKLGIEATVPLLQGAWALVWFDTSDNTLNFLRNKERPFWYAYTENFDHMIWASEFPTIRAALDLSANPYKLYKTAEGYSYFATKEDWWYKIDLDKLKAGATERPKPRVKELKGKEPAPAQNYACGGYTPFKRQTQGMSQTSSTTTSHGVGSGAGTSTNNVTVLPGLPGPKKDVTIPVLHLTTTGAQPFAEFLTEEEFKAIAKYGCSWCQADVSYDEPGVQVYVNHDMILCPSCADENETNRVYVDASRLVC